LNTVFGLSLTSTGVGWVLVEGHAADGAILDHEEFAVRSGGGSRAVGTARRVAAAVLRADEAATADEGRLRAIGVTWSDDAAAGAALLVEQLTTAGFDNVMPVRWVDAAETLAQGLAPVIGYDKTAVCVLGHESTTVVMIDTCDGENRTAVKHVTDGGVGLFRWVTRMFDRDGWRPDGVVLVGSDAGLEGFSSELNDALPVPVFAQHGAELAIARGAAMASAQHDGFAGTSLLEPVAAAHRAGGRTGLRTPSYTGALTALIAASVTLVGSLSLAVGLRLTPDQPASQNEAGATEHLVHALPAPRVADVPIAPPAPIAQPQPASPPEPAVAQPPAPVPEQPATESSGSSSGGEPEQPAAVPPVAPAPVPPPAPEAPPPDPHPLLTRVLEHIRGHQQDPPPAQPPDGAPPSP
jgi:hypothetical protein